MFIHKNYGRSLRFAVMTLVAMFLSLGAFAQNISVTGTVTDKSGEPIIGAFVLVQGTTNGTSTDVDGKYTLNAPSNGTLVFTLVGMKDAVAAINGKSQINVVMEEDAVLLDDVVVIGFGTQKKENLTGAVASVNTSKALEGRAIADVGRGLQGMTPGLNVQVGSAEVGSESIIRIRGQVGSLQGGSSPLILLDNVEIPSIQMVNPDDIESISVLKDAASSAIYGAKAAFGVILITSKKGAKTESVTVSYSGNVSFQNMAKDYRMADVDGLHYTVEAAERIGTMTPTGAFWLIDRAGYNAAVAWKERYGDVLDPNEPMVYGRDWYVDASNRKIGVRTYNPYDYLVRKGAPTHSHNLSLAGKSGKTNYNISLSYLNQSGMMKTTNDDRFTRYNANVRVASQLNDYINIHAGLMFSKTKKEWAYATNSTSADIWLYTYRWGPTYPLVAQDEYGNNLKNATYETAAANTADNTQKYTSANVGVTVTPIKNWNIDFDYTYSNNEKTSWLPGTRFYGSHVWWAAVDTPDEKYVDNEWAEFNALGSSLRSKWFAPYEYTTPNSSFDSIYRDAYTSERNTFNAKTTYDLNIKDKHVFKFMVGLQGVSYKNEGNWSKKLGLLDIHNPQFDLATGTQTSGGGHSWDSQFGVFARVNYNFKEKYLLEANVRYDASSKFPKNMRWRWFPSFSAGWRVTEEPWMEGAKDVLSMLKIRASWGSIGDQSVPGSLYIPTMGLGQSSWLHGGEKDFYFSTPGAVYPDITWQDITTFDVGVDFALFNDLNVTFDWFNRRTENMIVPMEGIGFGFGTGAPKGNFGSLKTNGWELSLNYGHVFRSGFSLSVSAGIADAITTIQDYGTSTAINGWYNGKTYGEIWGYRVDRLFQNDDFKWDAQGNLITIKSKDGYNVHEFSDPKMATQGFLNDGSLVFGPGDVKFKDLNGDGVINNGKQILDDHGDLDVIGNTTPRFEYNFRVDLAYKGFDFSAFFQGIGKRDMWGTSQLTMPGYHASDGAMAQTFAGDFWYETKVDGKVVDANYDAFYPRAANNGGASKFNMNVNDRYLLNMAYLRLKNVTLGYTLPQKITKKAWLQKVRFYVSLENFLTFDHLNGLPVDVEEIPGYSSFRDGYYNMDRAGVGAPAFKSASCGLQLTF